MPAHEEDFDEKVEDTCTRYRVAPELAEQEERVISTDELTGAQALEHKAPKTTADPGQGGAPRVRVSPSWYL